MGTFKKWNSLGFKQLLPGADVCVCACRLKTQTHRSTPVLCPQGPQHRGAPPPSLSQRKRDSSARKCSTQTLWNPALTHSLRPTALTLSPPPKKKQEVNCTLFLLAGYVKYGRPHAWIRSNHERLVNIGGTDSMVKDTPMKLKSISDWQTRGMETMWGIQTGESYCFTAQIQ